MKKDNKRSNRVVKIIITVLIILVLLCCVPVIILAVKYHRTSYINEAPVERSDSYVRPEYPEVIIGSDGISDLPEETEEPITEPETETELVTETEPVTDTEPEDTTYRAPRDTEAPTIETARPKPATDDTKAPTTTKPSETTKPSAPVTTKTAETTESKNNSFGTSPNAVSVYSKKYPMYSVKQKNKDIINILVMGTDARDVTIERGRSDTMLIVSYNKKTAEVKMVSLLRDALVPIQDHDWNRLNTAYAFGGAGLAINTMNDLFGLDLQNFVVIDFTGAAEFIDKIGGVDVNLTKAEVDYYSAFIHQDLVVGMNHMDSKLAMAHMQNRTTDSDFGRARRQRDVITAVMNKILTGMSITEISDLIDYAMTIVKTNIPATTLVSLATSVLSNASKLSFSSQQVPYADSYQFAWYNRMAILSFDIDEAAERLCEFIYGE